MKLDGSRVGGNDYKKSKLRKENKGIQGTSLKESNFLWWLFKQQLLVVEEKTLIL